MKTISLTASMVFLGLMSVPSSGSPLARSDGVSLGPSPLVQAHVVKRKGWTYKGANTRKPSRRSNRSVPAYQRGSNQQTGGPARELIPRR